MDPRCASRASAAYPKVRRIGFFAPQLEPDPTPPPSDSPALTSVAIPPPRHLSAAVTVPDTGIRRQVSGDLVPIGSYNPTESLLGTSPAASSLSSSIVGVGDKKFSEDSSAAGWYCRGGSDFTGVGFDLPVVKPPESSTVVNAKNLAGGTEKMESAKEVCPDPPSISKPLKAKTTKAERRALQEAQRAVKAASKAYGNTTVAESGRAAPSKKYEAVITKERWSSCYVISGY